MSLINREALLAFESMDEKLCASCGEHHAAEDVIMMIKTAPAIDSVPVVRCRECKHYETADFDGNILCGCTLHPAMLDITPDSYCSYGERKEGAE